MIQNRTTPTLIADRLCAALDAGVTPGPPAAGEAADIPAARPVPASVAEGEGLPRAAAEPLPEAPPVCVEEAWRRARFDYERGVSGPVAAERHGLSERTLRRRAAAEEWARPPRRPASSYHALMLGRTPPPFSGEPDASDDLEEIPELEMFLDAHGFEVGELLMHPEPSRLARFAFRRAAEAAARGAVAEAAAWMRLVAQVGRSAERIERTLEPVRGADLIRARYAADLRALADDALSDAGPDAAGWPE